MTPAAPGSTGQPVVYVPYTDGIGLNIQSNNSYRGDIAIDQGTGDSAVLVGSGGAFKSGVTLERVRIRKAAAGNKVAWGKHGVYMDCFNSTFLDFDIQGSQFCSDGFSIRMGGTVIRRASISDCYLPIGIFDSDTGQSNGTVVIEDVVGTFSHDTAVWCDAQDEYKTTFDLHVTFRRCSMTGPGVFLKADRVRNGTFRFEDCTLNGQQLTAKDVPAGSTINQGAAMTDQDLAAAADKAFRATTVSYPKWLQNVNAGKYPAYGPPSQWGIGFQALKDIGATTPTPTPTPGTPTMRKPYRADAWPNTPVNPNQPNLLKRNAQAVDWLVHGPSSGLGYHFSLGYHGIPTYYADASTPRVTVQQNLRTYASKMWPNVPIDPSWKPSTDPDEPDMCIFDVNGDEWFFYKVTAPGVTPKDDPGGWAPNQYWQATGVGKVGGVGSRGTSDADCGFPGGWQGYCQGGTAGSTTFHDAGMNVGAGKVKNWETMYPPGSDWGHALCCSAPRVCYGHVYPSDFVTRSVTYDASELTAVPSGTRFWLDPAYDVENAVCDWPNNTFGTNGNWYGKPLAEVDKQLLRTMQKYGCYINDQNGGPPWRPTGNDNSVVIITEGSIAPKLRGETTIGWEQSVMAPNTPRLPRSAVARLRVTSFFPQSVY